MGGLNNHHPFNIGLKKLPKFVYGKCNDAWLVRQQDELPNAIMTSNESGLYHIDMTAIRKEDELSNICYGDCMLRYL